MMSELTSDDSIGARIKAARRSLWTQSELGDVVGVTGSTIKRIENGHRSTTVSRLHSIADALGVELTWLLGAKGVAAQGVARYEPAVRAALTPVAALEGIEPDGLMSLHEVTRGADWLWSAFWSGKFTDVLQRAPEYVLAARALAHERADEAAHRVLAEVLWCAGLTAANVGWHALAQIGIAEAISAVRRTSDRKLGATIGVSWSFSLGVSNRPQESTQIAKRTANYSIPDDWTDLDEVGVHAYALCMAARTLAVSGDLSQAVDYLHESERVAALVGTETRWASRTPCGPQLVTITATNVYTMSEAYEDARKAAEAMPSGIHIGSTGTAFYLVDRALAELRTGAQAASLRTLMEANRVSSEIVREPQGRMITSELANLSWRGSDAEHVRQLVRSVGDVAV